MRYTSYAQNERQQKKAAKTVPKSIPPTTTHLRLRRSRRLLRLWIPRSHPSKKRLKSRRTHWKRRRLLWRRPKKKWHPWNRRRQRQMLRPLKKRRRPKQRLCWRSCWPAAWVRMKSSKNWDKIGRVDKLNSRSSHGFFEGRYIVYNGNKRNGVWHMGFHVLTSKA